MRSAPRRFSRIALVAPPMIVLAIYGCREATQVTLVITSPRLACSALKGVQISVAGDRGEAEKRASGDFVTATITCRDPASPDLGTLVITPGPSGNAAIVIVSGIRVDARSCKPSNGYAGCVVARRSVSFRQHVSATLPIAIDPACVDVPCDVATTCKKGTCISADVTCSDDGSCVSNDPRGRDNPDGGVDLVDAAIEGALPDGATSDAPTDASGVDSSDGAVFMPPQCPTSCNDPNLVGQTINCVGGDHCCQSPSGAGGVPPAALACKDFSQCIGTPAGGIVLCCEKGPDCTKAGEVCCFTSSGGAPTDPPRGGAVCMPPAQCKQPNQQRLCFGSECGGPPAMCRFWAPNGFFTNLSSCQ